MALRAGIVAAAALLTAPIAAAQAPNGWSIAIHGGAGVIERKDISAEQDAQYRAALAKALAAGEAVLARGGAALDAVEAAATVMEDDPLFNAGRGAVFTAEGRNELDASVMDGRSRAAGAVAGVTRTRNPIRLARAVMERSPHVFLAGRGADRFSREQGLEQVAPAYFFTESRWRGLETALRALNLPIPRRPQGAPPAAAPSRAEAPLDERKYGTVGVVARDRAGNFAAGTSTGGTTAKRWGRVGDAPVIGAGTYAQNGVCAVSATGTGEYFIRIGVARAICARIEHRGEDGAVAARRVIDELGAIGGDGGVIVLGPDGAPAFALNTSGMYRAAKREGGQAKIAIYADE